MDQIVFAVYREWKHEVASVSPMRLKHRSVLIKCCQAQYIPNAMSPDSTLKALISSLPPIIVPLSQYTRQEHDPLSYFTRFSSMMTPVQACVLLDICRSMPLDLSEVEEARVASWQKEGRPIENLQRPFTVNWNPIFDLSTSSTESVLPGVRPNPPMARLFHSYLLRWKRKLSGSILYPRSTNKNMSRATRREFEQSSGISLQNTPIFSQRHYLRYALETGEYLSGVTEMRQKWYRSGVKPRTYFAQGGEHYEPSMHLQDPYSDLVNSNPITHHVSRLLPTRILLRDNSRALIYDLATFTSNMVEQRAFQRRLEDFCRGTVVGVVSVTEGLIYLDLGEMIERYNQACVFYPGVSYERCVPERDAVECVTDHGTASMLGIFGNLMSCTFAHAAIVGQCVTGEDQINIAGDDGLVDEDDENEREIDLCICAVGEYERSKTFKSTEPGCICLKRPLTQTGFRLQQGIAIIPPTISLIGFLIYDIPDPRYTDFSDYDWPGRYSIVGKDMMRFLRSVHRAQAILSDEDIDSALIIAGSLHEKLFGSKYRQGGLMQCGDPFFWPVYPSYEGLRREDPLVTLAKARYNGHITLNKEDLEAPPDVRNVDVGDVFRCNSSRRLSLLEHLGFLERRDITEVFFGFDGYDRLIKSLGRSSDPILYEYECVKSIASHLLY